MIRYISLHSFYLPRSLYIAPLVLRTVLTFLKLPAARKSYTSKDIAISPITIALYIKTLLKAPWSTLGTIMISETTLKLYPAAI